MTASVPPQQLGVPTALQDAVLPILPGGGEVFTKQQMDRIRASVASILILLPQSATKVPPKLMDGMTRLARHPWWPVSGQAADAWVYWDAAGQAWRYTSTAPTTT